MVYFTSDLHLYHNKSFIFGNPKVGGRGYDTIEAMMEELIANWRAVVTEEDDVYILGDLMLDPAHEEEAIEIFNALPGRKHIAKGNHDRGRRWGVYRDRLDIEEMAVAYDIRLKWKGEWIPVYMSHFITIPYAISEATSLTKGIALHGHTHSTEKFEMGVPYIYNVALDAHAMHLVSWDEVMTDIEKEASECLAMLK